MAFLLLRGPAKARTMAYFGEGQGPIHLDNVECNGTENTLAECKKQDSGIHNCWHSEDAGVICDYVEKKMHGLSGTRVYCGFLVTYVAHFQCLNMQYVAHWSIFFSDYCLFRLFSHCIFWSSLFCTEKAQGYTSKRSKEAHIHCREATRVFLASVLQYMS